LSGLAWIRRDLSRERLAAVELKDVDTIFHLAGATLGAGDDECLFCEANEATTVGLLKECAGKVQKFVHVSSQAVYGNINHLAITEDFPLAGFDSAYACSKVNAENWIRWFQRNRGGRYVVLRFCGFIEGGGIIDYLIDQALQEKPIELFSNGQVCRDYLSVTKGLEAIVAASQYKEEEGLTAFNIGCGQAVSTRVMAEMVCRETGSTSAVVLVDKAAARANFVFDIAKARKKLGFEPGSLVEAIRFYVREKIKRSRYG